MWIIADRGPLGAVSRRVKLASSHVPLGAGVTGSCSPGHLTALTPLCSHRQATIRSRRAGVDAYWLVDDVGMTAVPRFRRIMAGGQPLNNNWTRLQCAPRREFDIAGKY